MIDAARRRRGDTIDLLTGDMRDIARLFPRARSFALVYCLGNSIAHLNDPAEVSAVLTEVHRLLAPGGSIVIQIVNFDRLLAPLAERGDAPLPDIRARDGAVVLRRRYKPVVPRLGGASGVPGVLFRTELELDSPEGRRRVRNTTPLLVLTAGTLRALVERAGFTGTELFGGFDGSAWTPNSFPLILAAEKG